MKKVESLYIHFPFCRHKCNYCDFYKVLIEDGSKVSQFHDYLESSLVILHQKHEQWGVDFSPLKSLYLGGGTPSLWGKDGAIHLDQLLKNHGIELERDVEFTLEVNPGGWTEDDLQAWFDVGCNRISFGMQTLNESVFPYLDRVHSIKESIESLKYISKMGVNFSVDFMLGLPESQKYERDVIEELERVLSFNPSHFSLYILTTPKDYIHKDLLPSEEYVEKEFLAVSTFLRSKGFNHYEVSNFALPKKESFHNTRYWSADSVAALGPSATGFVNLGESAVRYKWFPNRPDLSLEQMDAKALWLERLYLGLRTDKGIDLSELFDEKKINIINDLSNKWKRDGLISRDKSINGRLVLNSRGFLVMDSLMNEIFQHI